MDDSPSPPLFQATPQPPLPTKKGLSGCAIAAIVLGVLLVMIAVLVALAVPTFQKIQDQAQKAKLEGKAKVVQVLLSEAEKAEAEKFAHELVQTVEAKQRVHDFVDYEFLGDLIYSGLSDELSLKSSFASGMRKTEGGIFADVMGQPGRFVRHWIREGVPALTLRFEMPSGGVTYLDALLLRQKGGGFKVVDGYNYLFGILVSREVRTATILMSGSNEGLIKQVLGGAARKQDMDRFLRFCQAVRAGSAKEALTLYRDLSADQKQQSITYVQYVKALQMAGEEFEEEYVQALEKARGILGADVTIDLLLVDRHYLRQDFAAARKSVESSLKTIGDDSYLYFLLGMACVNDKDLPAARDALKRALAIEPDLFSLVDLELMILASEKDYPALLARIKSFEARTGAVITPDLLTETVYEDFKKSPEFAAWAESQRRKAP